MVRGLPPGFEGDFIPSGGVDDLHRIESFYNLVRDRQPLCEWFAQWFGAIEARFTRGEPIGTRVERRSGHAGKDHQSRSA